MATQEDIDRIVDAQSWNASKTPGGHTKYTGPNGEGPIFGPSTPSDHRALDNLASQLRRAGLAVPHANGHKPRARTGATTIARDYMRSNPDKIMTSAHLQLMIRTRIPDVGPNVASAFLSAAHKRGEVDRFGHSEWRWHVEGRSGLLSKPQPTPAPAPVAAPVEAAPVISVLVSDVAQEEDDKRILDESLAALGRIETVMQRTKKKIEQLEALRKLLNSAGG